MCFSRTSFSKIGYQKQRIDSTPSWRNCLVRIEIDGNKLNHLYKSHPVNYFIDNNDSKIRKYTDGLNPNVDYKQIARLQMHEYEDRLLSNKSMIKNANYYIKRVDILINRKLLTHANMEKRFKMFGDVLLVQNNIDKNKIFIYDNVDSFNKMSIKDGALVKNAINDELLSNKERIKTNYNDELSESCLSHIGNALAVVSAYNSKNELETVNYLIDKYGLINHKKILLEIADDTLDKIHGSYDAIDTIMRYISLTKTNFKNGGLWVYAVIVDEMFNDFCKNMSLEYKNIQSYMRAFYLYYYSKEEGLKITPKYKNILTFILSNNNKIGFNNFLKCVNKRVEEIKNM